MDAKEFYKDTYGEDAPNMFTTCMSKFVFEFAEAYAQQTLPSLPKWEAINNDPEGITEDDDFIARINGYVLRVEQMDYCNWWYSVGIGTVELCNKTGAYNAEEAKRFATGTYLEHYLKYISQTKAQ